MTHIMKQSERNLFMISLVIVLNKKIILIIKFQNLKLAILLEYQNRKMFLLKDTIKIKNTASWTCLNNDLNNKEITRAFHENELQKTNQQKFRIEKVIKKKEKKYVSIGKVIIAHLSLDW